MHSLKRLEGIGIELQRDTDDIGVQYNNQRQRFEVWHATDESHTSHAFALSPDEFAALLKGLVALTGPKTDDLMPSIKGVWEPIRADETSWSAKLCTEVTIQFDNNTQLGEVLVEAPGIKLRAILVAVE